MKKINEAYEILSDATRRAEYDLSLKGGRTETKQDYRSSNPSGKRPQAPNKSDPKPSAPKKKRLGWYLSWPMLFITVMINIPVGIALLVCRCLKVILKKDLYKRKSRAIWTVLYLFTFILFIFPAAKEVAEGDGTVSPPLIQSTIQENVDVEKDSDLPETNGSHPSDAISSPTDSSHSIEPISSPNETSAAEPGDQETQIKELTQSEGNASYWSDSPDVSDTPNLFEIGGNIYSISGLNKEFIRSEFQNTEEFEDNSLIDEAAKVAFHFDDYDILDSVFLLSETDSLYKNVKVGMTEAEITEILGPTDYVDGSGKKFWGYDINGNLTNDESCFAYLIIPNYGEDGKARMLILSYNRQPISEIILVSVTYEGGFMDFREGDASVYLDGFYMATVPTGETRILMIPYDEQNHEIVVKKHGSKTASATFGLPNYSTMDDQTYCVGYQTDSNGGGMHINETDFEYAMEGFFPLYSVLIDGEAVELLDIDPGNWINVFQTFAQQHLD